MKDYSSVLILIFTLMVLFSPKVVAGESEYKYITNEFNDNESEVKTHINEFGEIQYGFVSNSHYFYLKTLYPKGKLFFNDREIDSSEDYAFKADGMLVFDIGPIGVAEREGFSLTINVYDESDTLCEEYFFSDIRLFFSNEFSEEKVEELKQLNWLIINDYHADFNLEILASLSNLKALYLWGLYIEGDIESICGLTNLQNFQTRECKSIKGDIGNLAKLHQLVNADLNLREYDTLYGDIKVFSELGNLKYLDIFSWDDENIYGDITSFQDMDELRHLTIHVYSLCGDISALGDLVGLEVLSIHSFYVNGDIDDLASLINLVSLNLAFNTIGGDIALLKKLKNVQTLDLSYTDVHGNIAALSRLGKLSELDIDGTDVYGKIELEDGEVIQIESKKIAYVKKQTAYIISIIASYPIFRILLLLSITFLGLTFLQKNCFIKGHKE